MLDMYGTKGADGSFAANCLLARRLAERGVRFIQLYHRDWDHHGDLEERTSSIWPRRSTRPRAALVTDLKQRGMLDDTLVVWGGEFGRTPMAQGKQPAATTTSRASRMWLAGGGIKGGITHGATDELGYKPSRTSSTSTTCTPRCSTCSASTTSGSPSASRAATSA